VTLHQLRDEDGGMLVAVKTATQEGQRALQRDLDNLRGLRHPSIVPLYGTGPSGELVMEFVDGVTLSALVTQCGGQLLPLITRLEAQVHISSAMTYLHARGVVHRDLKPDNVLVSADKRVFKLCDFGLARRLEGPHTTNFTTTPRYMSPELAGGGAFGQADDVWAFAGVLLELSVGRRPYDGFDQPLAILREISQGRTLVTEMLPHLDRRTPQPIRDLAERCCRIDATQRGSFADAWRVCQRTLSRCVGFQSDMGVEWSVRVGCSFRDKPLNPHDTRGREVLQFLVDRTGRSKEALSSPISRLRLVRNDALQQAFQCAQEFLRKRCLLPAVFGPKWRDPTSTGPSAAEQLKYHTRLPDREWTMRQLEAVGRLASPMHNEAEPHTILLVFHCTSRGAATKICETGFAALASVDPGYFGQGMYFSPDADYAWNVYGLLIKQQLVEKEMQGPLSAAARAEMEPVLLACWLVHP